MPEYFTAVLRDGLVRIWTLDRAEIVRTVGLFYSGGLIELVEVEKTMQLSGFAVCGRWAVVLRDGVMTLEAPVIDRAGASLK